MNNEIEMLNNSVIFDNHRLIIQNINCIYAKSLTSRSERYKLYRITGQSLSLIVTPSPFKAIYSPIRTFSGYIFEALCCKTIYFKKICLS